MVEVIFEKTKKFRDQIYQAKDETVSLDPFSSYSYFVVNRAKNCSVVRVVDVGGACGAHYFVLRRVLSSEIQLKWHVVETHEMARSSDRLKTDELTFHSSIDDPMLREEGPIDSMHQSGVLQYIKDPLSLLEKLMPLKARYALFLRLSLTDQTAPVVTVQHSTLAQNGIGPLPDQFQDAEVCYPHIMLSELNLERCWNPTTRMNSSCRIDPVLLVCPAKRDMAISPNSKPYATGRVFNHAI